MPARLAAKPDFANRALSFVSGASRRRKWLVLVIGGALVATLAGPFGTLSMPFWPRLGFWLSVCLLNFTLWELWFAWLGRRRVPWRRILLLGFPVMLLPLPLEVDLALRLFAGTETASHFSILLRGAAIAGLWLLAILLLPFHVTTGIRPAAEARFPGTAIKLAEIAALVAEDHYVRLHLADGTDRLLHARFADAVAAMAPVVGEQVSRGGWIADAWRGPAEYRERRWFVRAGSGLWLPVSRGHLARLRDRGWLAKTA